jgi:hypothetical protein
VPHRVGEEWGCVWYPSNYSPQLADYEENLWTPAVGGGDKKKH